MTVLLVWFVVFRLESGDDRVVLSNGLVLHQRQCLSTFGPAWLEAIVDFGASLRRHTIDISTLACMAALALITCKSHLNMHIESEIGITKVLRKTYDFKNHKKKLRNNLC